jgi:hypothetical protein
MKRLSIFMIAVGASLIVLLPFAFDIWPAGFRWGHPHGAVMTYDAVAQDGKLVHLAGDVPLLLVLAAALAVWHPRRLAGLSRR